ncbi:MAG: hypothetical protein O6945_06845, partial [Gammaproteobacteria bacterium]|nr:hypothetical protein [Gammaproteobacteria bacterium]
MVSPTDNEPKAELHCHLDGLLSPSYVKAIQADGFCPDLDLEELGHFYPVKDIDAWFRLGRFYDPFQQGNGELLLEVLKLYLADLIAQNVRYVEIMLCSFIDLEDERLELLLQQYRRVADNTDGIEVGYLWATGRDKFEKRADRVRWLWQKGYIEGIALAGDEKACTVKNFKDIFQDFARENIPIEIHAGEWCGPDSIWDAIEYGHPLRLGHSLTLFDDAALPRYLLDKNIHVEFCPTSNLKVGGVKKIDDHPIFKALEYGLNFSINTDDPGHFECTMN